LFAKPGALAQTENGHIVVMEEVAQAIVTGRDEV
jgi:hypothetical protein